MLRCELVHSTVECDRGETSTSAGGHKAIGAIRANAVAIDWQEKNSKAAACAESRPTRVSDVALRWIERKLGPTSTLVADLERFFRRFAYPLVAWSPTLVNSRPQAD